MCYRQSLYIVILSMIMISKTKQEDPVVYTEIESNETDDDGEYKDEHAIKKATITEDFFKGLLMEMHQVAKKHPHEKANHKLSTCYSIAITYISAYNDLRRFHSYKYLFENNVEFEIGYLVNEIIEKYQRMLELFYNVHKRYYNFQRAFFAPTTFMVYKYTSIVEMGNMIYHLCNMLKEIEPKYVISQKKRLISMFGDYGDSMKYKKKDAKAEVEDEEFDKRMKQMEFMERQLLHEAKKRERARKKLRKKNLVVGFSPTPPSSTQRKSKFPLQYGWSIEHWW